MKTICGMSLRGAAYFGASVHIFVGLVFFLQLLDRLVYHVYQQKIDVDSLSVDKESVIYFGLFLPLGILIFKAIDKDNKTLLKWTSAVFLALQLFGVIIRLKYGNTYTTSLVARSRNPLSKLDGEGSPSSPNISFDNLTSESFKALALVIILTLAYLIILYLYTRQLDSFPGRIYGHQGHHLPLYSTASSTYFLPEHHHHHHHHGNGVGGSGRGSARMAAPFAYGFEPPPPYSSGSNLNAPAIDGQGQVQFQVQMQGHTHSGHQQQAAGSSRAMFGSLGRTLRSTYNKKNIPPLAALPPPLSSNINNLSGGGTGACGGGSLNNSSSGHHHHHHQIISHPQTNTITILPVGVGSPAIIGESDSASAPLLQSSRSSNRGSNLSHLNCNRGSGAGMGSGGNNLSRSISDNLDKDID